MRSDCLKSANASMTKREIAFDALIEHDRSHERIGKLE